MVVCSRTLTTSVQWAPPPLSATSGRVKLRVPLAGVERGDVVSVSHSRVDGEFDVLLSGVASEGAVVVALRFDGSIHDPPVDIGLGILRVVVGQWSDERSAAPRPPPSPSPPAPPPPGETKLIYNCPALRVLVRAARVAHFVD
jgi:hypothetical protein